jgi:hypothetical protein
MSHSCNIFIFIYVCVHIIISLSYQVASRMFTNRLLRESTLVAKKHSSRMIEHFTKKCNEKENKGSISVDIQDMFFRLTMDIFTFIAFGEDLDSVTRKEPHAFATAFDTV